MPHKTVNFLRNVIENISKNSYVVSDHSSESTKHAEEVVTLIKHFVKETEKFSPEELEILSIYLETVEVHLAGINRMSKEFTEAIVIAVDASNKAYTELQSNSNPTDKDTIH